MNGRVEFMNIYGQTLEKLETTLKILVRKNLKPTQVYDWAL